MLAALSQVGWRDIVSDIPRDAGAIIVYLLLIVFIGLVWLGSAKSRRAAPPPEGEENGNTSGSRENPPRSG